MANVNQKNGKLFIDFRHEGKRYKHYTDLPDTKMNRRRAETIALDIVDKLKEQNVDISQYLQSLKGDMVFDTKANKTALGNEHLVKKLMTLVKGENLEADNATPKPLFSEFAETWFQQMQPSWRHSTQLGYRNMLDNVLIPYLGNKVVDDIQKKDIYNLRAELTTSHARSIKAKTVNKFIKLAKMIVNEAADQHNFTSPLNSIKSLKEEKFHIQPFSLEEVQLLIAQVRPDYRVYLMVRLLLGLRTAEVDGLKWKYVDFERGQILVRETFSKGRTEYTKNDSSQREVQAPPMMMQALREHKEAQDQFFKGADAERFVFSSPEGMAINNSNFLNRIWNPLLRQLNLPLRRPYEMRHTAATLWLAAGENPTWIARQLGHTDTQMLFKVYARYVPNMTHHDGSASAALLCERLDLTQVRQT